MNKITLLNKISAGINIHLIVQYYKCAHQDRQKEIDICLRNNLQNQYISSVHVLTEVPFDFSGFPNEEKINQTVIGERLTFERAFQHANQHQNDDIWMLSNSDIYFDETLQCLLDVCMDKVVFALTRHDVQPDGSIQLVPPEYAHGSQDVWIFKAPIPTDSMFTSFCLGIPGCDHRIAHEFVQAGYMVLNPSLKIIARHLDLASGIDIDERTTRYVALMTEEGFKAGKAAPPPYQYFLYPTEALSPPEYNLFIKSLELYKANHQLSQLEAEKAQLEAERARLEAEKARLEAEKAQLEAEKVKFIRDIHELVRQLKAKDNRIFALENSLSWRVTTPLRCLGKAFSVASSSTVAPVAEPANCIDLDGMAALVNMKSKSKPTVLILDFNLGGGSNLYSRNLIVNMERIGYKLILLEYRHGLKDYRAEIHTGEGIAEFTFTDGIGKFFKDIVDKLAVDFIAVSQLVSWPNTFNVLEIVVSSGVPYLVLIHDYFFVCPNWTLFDYQEKFCGVPDDPAVCATCLNKITNLDIPLVQHTDTKRIEPWRSNAGAFLKSADKVICFSSASQAIIKKAYPILENTLVQEHSIPDQHLFRWKRRRYLHDDILTIAVMGSIGVHKGSKIIGQLINDKLLSELPVRVVILGDIQPPPSLGVAHNDRLVIHGSYARPELASLLDEYNVSVVLISSIWPETFCYTASEALLLGYPVLCFNIGAQSDRVQSYDAGWVIGEPYFDGFVSIIQQIISDPQIVQEKSLYARKYLPVSANEHFSVISNCLNHKN